MQVVGGTLPGTGTDAPVRDAAESQNEAIAHRLTWKQRQLGRAMASLCQQWAPDFHGHSG